MNRAIARLACLLALVPAVAFGAGEDLNGEIRFQAETDEVVWVGQEVELRLDLWSDGFSFSDQLFVLPEVKGGYLLQADSSTVKLNETRSGQQWQGLRYTLLFYPQRAGRLSVPSFAVRFSARAAYGSEPAVFQFQTPALSVEARLPPGADSGALLVTSSDFTMESAWTPDLPAEVPGSLQVGDAVTLDVRRQARDVPGMVFAPLPDFSIDGLAAYPDPARVEDRVNRGSLTGVRSDSVTFVCEREGRFTIPELRFQWWDPEQGRMSEKIIAARELEVAANPAYAAGATAVSPGIASRLDWKSITVIAVVTLLAAFFGRRVWRCLAGMLRQRKIEREAGEPWAFSRVQKACASGTALEAYQAITTWLGRIPGQRGQLTMMQWAEKIGDSELLAETRLLQESVVSGSADEWRGRKLAQLLVKLRKQRGQAADRGNGLHPLNPVSFKKR